MPIFEYACRDCGHRFEKIVLGSAEPSCPACQGSHLQQQLSVFAVGGPSEKAAGREPAGACGTCGDPRGPGSCARN